MCSSRACVVIFLCRLVYRVCTVYGGGLAEPHRHVLLLFGQAGVHVVHSGGSDRTHPCVAGIAVLSDVRGKQGGGQAGVCHALLPVYRAGALMSMLAW
jgi:hypothetical protein